jgi:hypothetical protein
MTFVLALNPFRMIPPILAHPYTTTIQELSRANERQTWMTACNSIIAALPNKHISSVVLKATDNMQISPLDCEMLIVDNIQEQLLWHFLEDLLGNRILLQTPGTYGHIKQLLTKVRSFCKAFS